MKRKLMIFTISLLAFMVSYPCFFILIGSFMSQGELMDKLAGVMGRSEAFVTWSLLPEEPSLQSYIKMLIDTPEIFIMFWNSMKIVSGVIVGQVLVGVPAAWGIAKYKFPFRKTIFFVYIILSIMPFQVMMLSEYLVVNGLGLMDSLWAIIFPGIFATFSVFIIYVSFKQIPDGVIEAARIDGAAEGIILVRIGIPMARDGIISAMVLTFLEYWNLIEQPMTFLKTKSYWPLSMYFSALQTSDMGLNFCVSILALIPATLVFLAGRKYLESGIGTVVGKEKQYGTR